jgi:rod shape-determining protein MreC
MQQLLNFIGRNKQFFVFLLLQLFAIILTIQSQNYHRSKFISSTSFITGAFYDIGNSISKYFDLIEHNQALLKENAKLKSQLKSSLFTNYSDYTLKSDSLYQNLIQKYSYTDANVINNSYRMLNNTLTLDKGSIHGISNENGVVNDKGIIGIIENVGKRYSSVISVLNSKIAINAKIKNSDYFGSLKWPGISRSEFILSDIPKQALLSIGDTIVTGGFSNIFPGGLNIGKIVKIELPINSNYYELTVEPFIDYSNIKSVYIIKNLHKEEIETIEKTRN